MIRICSCKLWSKDFGQRCRKLKEILKQPSKPCLIRRAPQFGFEMTQQQLEKFLPVLQAAYGSGLQPVMLQNRLSRIPHLLC